MKRILITGAGGFLGGNLIQTCLESSNYYVTALTSKPELLMQKYGQEANFKSVGLNRKEEISWNEYDILVNCAFPRNVGGVQMAKGLEFIAALLKDAVDGQVGAVINISSQSVYCQVRSEAATERDSLSLDNKYAVGKYASELLTDTLCRNIPHTNLRMASLIGPGFDQRVTNKMVDFALAEKKLVVREGRQQFGFLDIEDAVRGIMLLIDMPAKAWKHVYNMGSMKTYSLKEIADTVAALVGNYLEQPIEIEVTPDSAELNSALDSSLLEADTGYRQSVSLEESIRRILAKKLNAI